MRTRERLFLGTIISGAASVMLVTMLGFSIVRVQDQAEATQRAQRVTVAVLEVRKRTYDYSLEGNARTIAAWQQEDHLLQQLLDPRDFPDAAQQRSVRALAAGQAELRRLFDDLVDLGDEPTQTPAVATAEKRLVARLAAQSQDMAAEATSIHEMLSAQEVSSQQRLAVLSVLIAIAGLGLAVPISVLTVNDVLGKVRRLSLGVARISRGDLHAKVELPAGDELGDLADGFNEMAAKLAESYEQLHRELKERRVVEEQLRFDSMLLDAVEDSVMVHDFDGNIIYCNHVCHESRGYSQDEFMQLPPWGWVAEERRESIQETLANLREQGAAIFESNNLDKQGGRIPVENHARVLRVNDWDVIVTVGRDITERKNSEALIARMAFYDPLTGLANRMLLNDRLAIALGQCRRKKTSLALMFLDIDDFKPVNDTLGHSVGDWLLKSLAARLESVVRESDTVARLGGDEFVLLVPEIDSQREAETVARKVLTTVAEPFEFDGRSIVVTASLGVAMYGEASDDAERLLRNADTAMYRAKDTGHNQLAFYNEAMNDEAVERFSLKTDLRGAIDRGELEIHYQPQIRLTDGVIVGAEALLRWHHPVRGSVSPDVFIPIAEESGLIDGIGEWVLDSAFAQCREWHDAGFTSLRVAVNLSPRQVSDARLISMVRRLLAESGLPASAVELEVTETAAMRDALGLVHALKGLRELGVSVAIDDFGTGYSSLEQIKRFPLDALKIDRAFVGDVCASAESAAIVKTVAVLGRSLGLRVVAEGVETDQQLKVLQDLHCDEAQGFLFSPGIPAEEFTEALEAGRRTSAA